MKQSSKEPLTNKHFLILLFGAIILVSLLTSLTTAWYTIRSTTPEHDDTGNKCARKIYFGWFSTEDLCEPIDCPCAVKFYPGLRTVTQCNDPGCPAQNELYYGIFSVVLLSFLSYLFALVLFMIPGLTHYISYGLAVFSFLCIFCCMIAFPAAMVPKVRRDAGSDIIFCTDGPCSTWSGTGQFNVSNAATYFVYWGPSTGWVFSVFAVVMILPWIGYAFWATMDHEIMGVVERE